VSSPGFSLFICCSRSAISVSTCWILSRNLSLSNSKMASCSGVCHAGNFISLSANVCPYPDKIACDCTRSGMQKRSFFKQTCQNAALVLIVKSFSSFASKANGSCKSQEDSAGIGPTFTEVAISWSKIIDDSIQAKAKLNPIENIVVGFRSSLSTCGSGGAP
jgi:hypothetical protein